MTPVEDVLARFRHRYLIIGSAHFACMESIGRKAISTFGLIPISPMRTGKRLSMMPLVLSSDLGSEESRRIRRTACIDSHRLLATAGRDA